jgi:hypothetical protein
VDRPTVIRAKLAYATRKGEPPEVIDSFRRDYYASRAHEYLRTLVTSDQAPTAEQRAELAAVLTGESR